MSKNLNEYEIEKRNEILKKLIELFILSIIGAAIGYSFCKYNQYSILLGLVLGITCPWGYVWVNYVSKMLYNFLEDLYKLISIVTFGIYAIVWFLIKIFISSFVGIIAMPVLIVYYIYSIYKTFENSTNNIPNNSSVNNEKTFKTNFKNMQSVENSEENNEKYYCERCFKEISYEESELYDNMCEECFMDTHIDNQGNYMDNLL